MRLLLVSQWYDPEGSSAALPGVISRAIMRRGHEVHVLTGFPNYPSGVVFDGYRVKPYRREDLSGITVHRAPLYASHDANVPRRAANYLSFALGATSVGLSRLPAVDAALVYGAPVTAAVPAMALKRVRKTPFVYHMQDLWPQAVLQSSMLTSRHDVVERTLQRLCDEVYRSASTVAVTSPSMAGHVTARGIPEEKVCFLPNWADERSFRPVAKDPALASQLGIDRRFSVMYAGLFGEYQALDVLVEAARLLRGRADIGFALVGGGVMEQSLRSTVARHELDNVTFAPVQPFARMSHVLALGDVQVIALRDQPLLRTQLPSKLPATLAAGRPVLGALAGDAADVLSRSGAGVLVPQGSADAMAQAIVRLADADPDELGAMGHRGREFYLRSYSEDVAVDRLVGLLERAAGHRQIRQGVH